MYDAAAYFKDCCLFISNTVAEMILKKAIYQKIYLRKYC